MSRKIKFNLPSSEITPEDVYMNRRKFLKVAGAGALGLIHGCNSVSIGSRDVSGTLVNLKTLKPEKNGKYVIDRPFTQEHEAASYTNFYEFSTGKSVWKYVDRFIARPWQLEISGLVNKPLTLDVDDLVEKMTLEERAYRHRCVEAWAMAVPWTGVPFRWLIKLVEPKPEAKYVRMLTFLNRKQAPGQDRVFGVDLWPYQEGLTIEEAANELTFIAVGIYGHELPKQHGAPIRLVAPWKYGFKSIKSIVLIDFTDSMPSTFWSMASDEYGFWANVNPDVPHKRWSQKTERMLGTNEQRPTVIYNGYGEYVASLYESSDGGPPGKEYFY